MNDILPSARSVDIEFKDAKLKDLCEDPKLAQKKLGKLVSGKLERRLSELAVAENLDELPPSGRLHLLNREFEGCYAIDLHGGCRLVIRPINDPLPRHPDGGIDRLRITVVRIEYIGDYHA